ncbi:MAG TPA: MFS transporter [bacterium]|nr:MFS transporter [bacterium]HPW39833.1 MFS transporter [bacterium]
MAKIFKTLYLRVKLSPGVSALYSSVIIDQIGSGLVGLFMPVFLLEKFGRIEYVLLYYFLLYGCYAGLAPVGAKIMSIIGLKRAMILSVPFKVVFYLCLFYLARGYPIVVFAPLMVAALEIRLALFWIPYHTNFARFTDKRNRGRVIAFLSSVSSLTSIAIPVIAGWVIANYDFEVLFMLVMLLVGISVVPLFLLKPTYEKFSFSFGQTWQNLFGRKFRRMFWSNFADGIENMIGAIIWPIVIFQLLQGDFLAVGAISSLIVFFSVALRMAVGSYTDKFDKRKLMRYGSVLYSLGWLFKVFVVTSFQIFVVSAYHSFAAIMMRTPFDALMYEKTADAGHYVDELTVLREMALNLGRCFCIAILFILINLIGLQWTFILAGIASLFVNLI